MEDCEKGAKKFTSSVSRCTGWQGVGNWEALAWAALATGWLHRWRRDTLWCEQTVYIL